jgi:small subunit ribosomal protein S6
MKKYELMTIVKMNMGEEGARNLSNEIKDVISKFKGKILNDDFWGKRKFAYEINGSTEGFYDVITFEITQDSLEKLKSKLNLTEGLVRYLITAE